MNAGFDLLGDPIDPNHGKRGRPMHIATEQNRKNVMMLLAFGWGIGRIAGALGVDEKTLRKNYSRELNLRAVARDRVRMLQGEACWREIEKGNMSALTQLDRMFAREDAALDKARFDEEGQGAATPLGKKEQRELAASAALLDEEWGDDLVSVDRVPKPN